MADMSDVPTRDIFAAVSAWEVSSVSSSWLRPHNADLYGRLRDMAEEISRLRGIVADDEAARLRKVIWETYYEMRDGAEHKAFAMLQAEMDRATPKEQPDK